MMSRKDITDHIVDSMTYSMIRCYVKKNIPDAIVSSITGIDFAKGAEQERMLYNDHNPVELKEKAKVESEFDSKCHLCGKECNKIGKVSCCSGGCK